MPNPPAALPRRQGARQAIAALTVLILLGPSGTRAETPDSLRAVVPAPDAGENHGGAVAGLPSGAWLVCWYSGSHEEDRSVRILCSRGSADGAAWSAPWTAVAPGDKAAGAHAPNKSLGNVTLAVTPD